MTALSNVRPAEKGAREYRFTRGAVAAAAAASPLTLHISLASFSLSFPIRVPGSRSRAVPVSSGALERRRRTGRADGCNGGRAFAYLLYDITPGSVSGADARRAAGI